MGEMVDDEEVVGERCLGLVVVELEDDLVELIMGLFKILWCCVVGMIILYVGSFVSGELFDFRMVIRFLMWVIF